MDATQLLWLLRIIGGLLIGFLIARKFRDFIRSIVIMCIPLKHRISEQSFQIQTRITTLVSILLALGIAIGLNYGLNKAMNRMGISKMTQVSSATLSPSLPLSKPANAATTKAPNATPPMILPNAPTPPKQPALPTSNPSRPQSPPASPTRNNPNTLKNPVPYGVPTPPVYRPAATPTFKEYQLTYYVQLYAFRDFTKAKQQQVRWQQHQQIPVLVGFTEGTHAPYKVIIGPFRNRPAAAYFIKANRLRGFPKPAHQVQVFQSE